MAHFPDQKDSICAVATPAGYGGIGVIRLSGGGSEEILRPLCPFLPKELESHRVYFGRFQEADDSIDDVLVTFFGDGRGYTGEKAFEISHHGNPLIGRQIVEKLIKLGARSAYPGEFTYRAFLNGKIDLPQAESVLTLIESQSLTLKNHALRQLRGTLSSDLWEIEDALTKSLAHLEANIDFSMEDIEIESNAILLDRLRIVLRKIDELIGSFSAGRALTESYRVAILGPPNVGKSSLLNLLLGQDRAIVTDVPGTTRDTLDGELIIEGCRVCFIDTAGIRLTDSLVEKIGIEKSFQMATEADLIWYMDAVGDEVNEELAFSPDKTLRVRNKSDLGHVPDTIIPLSVKNREGLDHLMEDLKDRLAKQTVEASTVLLSSRQYEGLLRANAFLSKGIDLLVENASPEFVVEEVRSSLIAVMEILGKTFDDEILDRVFSEFCLGK